MKKRKTMLLALLLCLPLAFGARAIGPVTLALEGFVVEDQVLRIFCSAEPQAEFMVSLGGVDLPVSGAVPFAETGEGVSYLFIADVSGSIGQTQLQAIRQTIETVADGLSERDNVSVSTLGDDLYLQPFVSEPDDIAAQIQAIAPTQENTNMYHSMVKALSTLATHENCHAKKVLVIFSDGEEYSTLGITFEETELSIKAARIPIYTVAPIGANPSNRYAETAKTLGSLARFSPGGLHFVHQLTAASSQAIAEEILDSVANSVVLSVDLSEFRPSGEDHLQVTATVEGDGTAIDGYAIPTAGFPVPNETTPPTEPTPPQETATPDADTVLLPTSAPLPSRSPEQVPLSILAAMAAVLGVAVFIVWAFVLRGRRPIDGMPTERITKPDGPLLPGQARTVLRLTRLGREEQTIYRAVLVDKIVVGRELSKCNLAFENDRQLSPRHFVIERGADGPTLRDLRSAQGTYVNGKRLQAPHRLSGGDLVKAGRLELRVELQ